MYAGCYKNITVSKMGCARICFLLVWVRILVLINSINTTLSWEKRLRRYPAPNGRHVLGKSYSKLRSQKLHRRVLEHIMNHTVATTASLKQLATPVFHKDAQYHAYRGNLVEPIQCHDCVDVFLTKEPITISVNQITEFRKAPHCVENDWEF